VASESRRNRGQWRGVCSVVGNIVIFAYDSSDSASVYPEVRNSMSLFSMPTFCTLDDLFLVQTQSLYDVEQRLTQALRRMADAISSKRLGIILNELARQSERQLARLEVLFQMLGMTAGTEICEPMKALIAEGDQILHAEGEPEVKEAALVAVLESICHYQIGAYNSAGTIARRLDHVQIDALLRESLDEETAALEKLTEFAESAENLVLVRG
jgi:ferritin-like metal-binding protein YciE